MHSCEDDFLSSLICTISVWNIDDDEWTDQDQCNAGLARARWRMGMDDRLGFVHDSFHHGWVSRGRVRTQRFVGSSRITYSLGDIYLEPMMHKLKEGRGPVSVIYGIVPAVTLATGEKR